MEKEKKWVNDILLQIENAQPVLPSKAFLNRMEQVAITQIKAQKIVNKPTLLMIAAGIAFLLYVNFIITDKLPEANNFELTIAENSEDQMFLIPTQFVNYD